MFLNAEVDRQWPLENIENEDGAESYPYPYKISNTWDWKEKAQSEIEETFED